MSANPIYLGSCYPACQAQVRAIAGANEPPGFNTTAPTTTEYLDAITYLKACDMTTVPWGQARFLEFFNGGGTPTVLGTSAAYLAGILLGYTALSYAFFSNRSDNAAVTWGLLRCQVSVPVAWNVKGYSTNVTTSGSEAGLLPIISGGSTCCTDPANIGSAGCTDIVWFANTACARIIEMPIPSGASGLTTPAASYTETLAYVFTPGANCP